MNVMRISPGIVWDRDNDVPGYRMNSWDLLVSHTVRTIDFMAYRQSWDIVV